MRLNHINVKLGSEYKNYAYGKNGDEPPMSEIFSVSDDEFVKGKIGVLATGGNFQFQSLVIEALSCMTQWEPRDELMERGMDYMPMTSTASFYKEQFSPNIQTNYRFPNQLTTTTENWKFKENVLHLQSILQFTVTNSNKSKTENPERIPLLAILKNRVLKNGEFLVDFMLPLSGTISLIFNYTNKSNFFTFDIGRQETEHYFQLRQITKDKSEIKSKVNYNDADALIHFQTYSFYRVKLVVIMDQITVYIKNLGKFNEEVAIEKKDYKFILSEKFANSKLDRTCVGLGGLDTDIIFSRLILRPPKDKTTKVITEKDLEGLPNDRILLFGYDNVNVKDAKQQVKVNKANDLQNLQSLKQLEYNVCLVRQTEKSINSFCNNKIDIEILKQKCKVK